MCRAARLNSAMVVLCILFSTGCESSRPTENVPRGTTLRGQALPDGPPVDRAIRSAGPIGRTHSGAGDRSSGPYIDSRVRSNGPPRPRRPSAPGLRASLASAGPTPSVIFDNTLTSERRLWLMSGTTVTGSYSFGGVPLEWHIVGAADIVGDAQPEIFFENINTGERGFWTLNGLTVTGFTSFGGVPLEWHIVGVADFTGDGRPEVLWENALTGVRGIWLMIGTTVVGFQAIEVVGLDWHIAAAADLTGDGKTDVVFENTNTGERGFWTMNGTSRLGFTSFGGVPLEWHIVGAGDFGNGQNEILWQNYATGVVGAWRMSGTTVIGFQQFGAPPLEWRARGVFAGGAPITYVNTFGTSANKVSVLGIGSTLSPGLVTTTLAGQPAPTDPSVTFASRIPGVATVDATGRITGIAAGQAWIVANSAQYNADSVLVIVPRSAGIILRTNLTKFSYKPGDIISVQVLVDTRGASLGETTVTFSWPVWTGPQGTYGSLSLFDVNTSASPMSPVWTFDNVVNVIRINGASVGGATGLVELATIRLRVATSGINTLYLNAVEALGTDFSDLFPTATSTQYPVIVP